MLTICAGVFLGITKATNEDVPLGSILIFTVLCDAFLGLLTLVILSDSALTPLILQLLQGWVR